MKFVVKALTFTFDYCTQYTLMQGECNFLACSFVHNVIADTRRVEAGSQMFLCVLLGSVMKYIYKQENVK